MTAIYPELLDAERKKVFLKLKPLGEKGGVLAGGTAIFLQIKGRRSFDFDIFFQKQVIKKTFNFLSRSLKVSEIKFERPGHLTFLTEKKIQVTLFRYQFSPLYPLVKTDSLPLFDLRDLAADKAYTLGRRPAWRDYVDLFFLLKNRHISLEKIIQDAQKKFGFRFAPKLFLEQLSYFDDIENFKIEFIGRKYSRSVTQDYLKKQVISYVKQNLRS